MIDLIAAAARSTRGDTAWMLAATALVLLMTPALGLFYAGLVRAKNTLNTFMMCVAAIAVATVTWALIGYSLAFDGDGDAHRRPRPRVPAGRRRSSRVTGTTIPHLLFMAFQATFCIITDGARVRRRRRADALRAVPGLRRRCGRCSSTPCWRTGRSAAAGCRRSGTLDFAGGVPVEMGSGFSALAAALVVGARKDYGRQALLPHNAVYVLLGAGLLWFGWFGFNGGSGFSTGNAGVLAFTNTLLTPACTLVAWFVLDLIRGAAGDGDRRGDGDHRRLRAASRPPAASSARAGRWRSASLAALPSYAVIVLAPADAGGRDARRARRARRRGLHGHPVHRLLRAGVVERRLRRPALRQRRPARPARRAPSPRRG